MIHACLPVIVGGMLIGDPLRLRALMAPNVIDFIVLLSAAEGGVQYGSIDHDGALLIFTKNGLEAAHLAGSDTRSATSVRRLTNRSVD